MSVAGDKRLSLTGCCGATGSAAQMGLRDRPRPLPELGGGLEIIAAIIESAMVKLNVVQPGLQARAMRLLSSSCGEPAAAQRTLGQA